MHTKRLASLTCAALIAGAVSGLSAAAASAASLSGAGSSLVAPIEAEWAADFNSRTGAGVTYQSVGSGTGIADISSRLVDFGASDAPLTSSQAGNCHGCYQIPWALSATGIGFHIGGVGRLRLTGSVIAQIYLGAITNWSDPRIASLNKHVHLPNLRITPVYRSDGSGDTYAFTDYLSRVSRAFAHQVGNATSVSFPHGVGGKGNSGVTAILESTNGAIAYVAVSYLIAHHLPAAAVRNNAGRYEYPNLNNIENAARGIHHVPAGNALHIVNPSRHAKIAYPISTFTYVIVPANAPQGSLLQLWIRYVLGAGQSFGPALDFAPVPRVVLNAAKATVNLIH